MQDELISRQAAIDAIYALCDTGETLKENPWRDNPHIDAVVETIEQLPPVNPQHTDVEVQKMQELEQAEIQKAYELGKAEEPKIGHWIVHPKGIYAHLICDNCLSNAPYDCRTNYCPDCGAKMVEPQESEVNE